MTIEVERSVVRLTMAEFEGLAAGDLPEDARLRVLGVPGMPEALAGVREPLLVLQVDLVVAAGGRTHFGWVGAEALALLLPVDDTVWQLLALPVDQLAVSLARIVGLGPGRGGPRSPRDLAANPFDAFFSADRQIRAAALEEHGVDVAWTLGVRSQDEEWLMAAAAGAAGPWLCVPAPGPAPGDGDAVPSGGSMAMVAEPVSATEIYRRFTTIVPGLLTPSS